MFDLLNYKTGVINDPLGLTHNLASSEHCFHFVLLDFEKCRRTYMFENNDTYWP